MKNLTQKARLLVTIVLLPVNFLAGYFISGKYIMGGVCQSLLWLAITLMVWSGYDWIKRDKDWESEVDDMMDEVDDMIEEKEV